MMYLHINAWREILARTMEGFAEEDNVSPDWLVNPATRRRLKLDKYYRDARLAVRFIGLTAKGQGRQSDWEIQETEQRDQTRAELCRQHGVQLLLIDPEEEGVKQIDTLIRMLSRTSRTLAQSDQPALYKLKWMPALSSARETAAELRSLMAKNPTQMMNNLADAWRDREAGLCAGAKTSSPPPPVQAHPFVYAVGQRVRHERFGDGVITAFTPSEQDTRVSILFDGGEERTFLSSLVYNKLSVIN
jgi:hypothetical protein